MQFIDLHAQQALIREKIDQNIKNVLDHGQYILGPEVNILEERLADYVGVKHCIGVSSGTDALLIAMMALKVGTGDEVIMPSFTYIATAETAVLLGAKPVYVDIDPVTYNMDPELIARNITARTRAIIPVSLYGQCADFDSINEIANQYNLPVIEDGAQSFGARYKSRTSCSLSTIGTTSFFPSKPLGAYGDAGAIFTNSDELALKMRQISRHGQDGRYHHIHVGVNGRLDTLQAAVLLAKLDIFDQEVSSRNILGGELSKILHAREIDTYPRIEKFNQSVYAQYTIRVNDRDAVAASLKEQGVPTAIHYPCPIHLQPAYNCKATFAPESIRASEQVLSLPFHPYITKPELIKIADAIQNSIKSCLCDEQGV